MIAQTCELESIPEEQADGTISKPGGLKSNEPTTPVSKPKLNMISDLLEDSKDKLSVNPMYNFDKSMSVASIQDQKVKFDEMDSLNIPLQWKSEFLPILLKMMGESICGAMVFLLMIGSLVVVTIFAGQLDNPSMYVTACGIGISYVAILISVVYGLDTGFNVVISRC